MSAVCFVCYLFLDRAEQAVNVWFQSLVYTQRSAMRTSYENNLSVSPRKYTLWSKHWSSSFFSFQGFWTLELAICIFEIELRPPGHSLVWLVLVKRGLSLLPSFIFTFISFKIIKPNMKKTPNFLGCRVILNPQVPIFNNPKKSPVVNFLLTWPQRPALYFWQIISPETLGLLQQGPSLQ